MFFCRIKKKIWKNLKGRRSLSSGKVHGKFCSTWSFIWKTLWNALVNTKIPLILPTWTIRFSKEILCQATKKIFFWNLSKVLGKTTFLSPYSQRWRIQQSFNFIKKTSPRIQSTPNYQYFIHRWYSRKKPEIWIKLYCHGK